MRTSYDFCAGLIKKFVITKSFLKVLGLTTTFRIVLELLKLQCSKLPLFVLFINVVLNENGEFSGTLQISKRSNLNIFD